MKLKLEQEQKIQKIIWRIFLGCLVAYTIGWFFAERLPDKSEMARDLYTQPLQTETDAEPFARTFDGKQYMIRPMFDYEISGLVVSYMDLDTKWFNIYYDNDPYNIKDLCLIWGGNLASNDFHNVKFWNKTWTCWYQHTRSGISFDGKQLSNNHILPATEDIAKRLDRVRRGDQIKIKGMLVSYSVIGQWNGNERKSSTVRWDTGNGACEVIYVTELEVIHSANKFFRFIQGVAFHLGVLALIAKGYVFFLL